MSGEHGDFADWLKARAEQEDYNFAVRGTAATFATDSGVDPAQMSRFLRGQAVPSVEGQRGIAKALGVKLPEVMVRAGTAEPDDFPSYSETPARPTNSLDRIADEYNASPAERKVLGALMRTFLETNRQADLEFKVSVASTNSKPGDPLKE